MYPYPECVNVFFIVMNAFPSSLNIPSTFYTLKLVLLILVSFLLFHCLLLVHLAVFFGMLLIIKNRDPIHPYYSIVLLEVKTPWV